MDRERGTGVGFFIVALLLEMGKEYEQAQQV